jgi:hypothetical protein
MLRSVEVTAVVHLVEAPFHNVHWRDDFEFKLDCFICRRTDRTTGLKHGAEQGMCSGDSKIPEHPAAVRVAAFDHTSERERKSLRTVVDYWWAPFQDAKRDRPAQALTRTPWVRLHLGYLCPEAPRPGTFSTQTNLVRPQTISCEHCTAPIARSDEAPRIRLLS